MQKAGKILGVLKAKITPRLRE